MKIIATTALKLLKCGASFALATILESSGSTPREAGASMLIMADGAIVGTVGGGVLEALVIESAGQVIKSGSADVVEYALDQHAAASIGAICGGRVKVLIDSIRAEDPNNLSYFEQLFRAAGACSQLVLIPDSGKLKPRNQCLMRYDGKIIGAEGYGPEIVSQLQTMQEAEKHITRAENFRVFLFPVDTNITVYIFGAGHCGEKLASALHPVGFSTVIIDDRREFCQRERFPYAEELIVPEWMGAPFEHIRFEDDSYIVIVTRGHMQDELVLFRALKTNAGYIGMIGSKKKCATIFQHLLDAGFTEADIRRVYSPIGIPIGAETPEEIAVSIAAELIKVRAEKKRKFLNHSAPPPATCQELRHSQRK